MEQRVSSCILWRGPWNLLAPPHHWIIRPRFPLALNLCSHQSCKWQSWNFVKIQMSALFFLTENRKTIFFFFSHQSNNNIHWLGKGPKTKKCERVVFDNIKLLKPFFVQISDSNQQKVVKWKLNLNFAHLSTKVGQGLMEMLKLVEFKLIFLYRSENIEPRIIAFYITYNHIEFSQLTISSYCDHLHI